MKLPSIGDAEGSEGVIEAVVGGVAVGSVNVTLGSNKCCGMRRFVKFSGAGPKQMSGHTGNVLQSR